MEGKIKKNIKDEKTEKNKRRQSEQKKWYKREMISKKIRRKRAKKKNYDQNCKKKNELRKMKVTKLNRMIGERNEEGSKNMKRNENIIYSIPKRKKEEKIR